jgi:hypothetical protein
VMTCRTEDYRRAVNPPEGPGIKLRAAAAVQLGSLTADTVAKYLIADAGGQAARARWAPVLEILGSTAPAAQALTTPLMAGLARVIYNPRPNEIAGELPDPAELCGPDLADRETVQAHLFDAFIPAAYRGASRWTANEAEPWLRFLAYHLEAKIAGPDLAWWQLQRVLGMPAFMRSRKPSPPPPEPSRRAGFRRSRLQRGVITGLVFGLAFAGLLTWAAAMNWQGIRDGLPLTDFVITALVMCIAAGLALGLAGGVVFGLAGVPDDLAHVASPGSVLARDRRATLVVALIPAISVGAAMGLIAGTLKVSATQGLGYGSAVGLLVACMVGLDLAWLPFVLTRGLLARRHLLPRRLMSFLTDAHQRGVLRQAGAVYQFRHVELQRRLAAHWEEPPKRWWHVPLDFSSNEPAAATRQHGQDPEALGTPAGVRDRAT